VKADDRCTPLDLVSANAYELPTDEEYNNKANKQRSQKALNGRHPYDLSQQYVDIEGSNKRLKNADLFAESVTIQHITAACEQLAPTEHVKRHDGLAKVIRQKLAEAAEMIDDRSQHYKYTPASVLENENFKLYWNRSILTDKTISFNRPDITFMNKKTKKTF